MALFGCDSFVVLPPLTTNGEIIFGKNSDRPNGEVQEIVYYPPTTFKTGDTVKCTYIEVDQVTSTNAVLLSKPAWMWGAEMGANNCGVVIGNEAVWTVVDDDCKTERLLGMDLLRLGLERSSSSSEAVDVITALLEKYGQGGPCSDTDSGLHYHNSFLIVDQNEAWVLETAGRLWAAEKITSGYRNISNCLSIGTNITKKSKELLSFAIELGLWDGKSDFNFKHVFSSGNCPREAAGRKLLANLTVDRQFNVNKMFQILRDKHSNICRPAEDPFHTSGSWVSALSIGNSTPCHWVTGTIDPSESMFKPFIFSPSPEISSYIISPVYKNDPVKVKPRFQFTVDRRHELYKLHELALGKYKQSSLKHLETQEQKLFEDTNNILQDLQKGIRDLKSTDKLLKSAIELEAEVYNKILN